jgi:hypothetical protein
MGFHDDISNESESFIQNSPDEKDEHRQARSRFATSRSRIVIYLLVCLVLGLTLIQCATSLRQNPLAGGDDINRIVPASMFRIYVFILFALVEG